MSLTGAHRQPARGSPASARAAPAPSPLLLGARDVLARARVDADHFAFVDEERHAHHGAGLELCGFLTAGRGIAAQPRVGLHHLQLDMRRWRHNQRHVLPQRHDADHPVLDPLGTLAHRGLAGGRLLEALRYHEMPEVSILIEVLHLGVDDIRSLERFARLEGALDGTAGLEIADLDAVERLTLARLDELVLDHGVGITVEQHFETATDLTGGVAGHLNLASEPAECARQKGPRMIAASPDPRQRRRLTYAGSARRLTRVDCSAVLES